MQNLFTALGLGGLLLAVVALFKPAFLLWWAADGKRTRVRASIFWLLAAFFLWSCGATLASPDRTNLWIGAAIFGSALAAWAYYLHQFNPKILERRQQKAEGKEQKRLAKQEMLAEKERQRQAKKDAAQAQKEAMHQARVEQEAWQRRVEERRDRALYKAWDESDDDSEGAMNKIYTDIQQAYENGEFDDDPEEYDNLNAAREEEIEQEYSLVWEGSLKEYFGKKVPRETSEKLKIKFGKNSEQRCNNIMMYTARMRKGEIYCIIPKDDINRARFDMLAANGVAVKFAKFDKEVLKALPLARLRDVGRAAGLKSLRSDKIGSCKMLCELSDEILARALEAAEIDLDCVFKLRKLEEVCV